MAMRIKHLLEVVHFVDRLDSAASHIRGKIIAPHSFETQRICRAGILPTYLGLYT